MKVRVLGSGSSLGVPAVGNFWGDCDPNNPRNRRMRASIMISSETTNVLVDTSPDLRHQLSSPDMTKIDAVIYSHAHSDHINGMEDLRPIVFERGHLMHAYSNAETINEIARLWPHVSAGTPDNIYTPYMNLNIIEDDRVTIGDIDVRVFDQDHGACTSLGLRVRDFAYCTDVLKFDEKALSALEGIKTWIVDAAGYHNEAPKSHAALSWVLEWTERLKPERVYLTDLGSNMDYDTLCRELPEHVRPAYDGLVIDIS